MTEQSHDRLATIAQNTALGSGSDVAMKDLELRGTGNLLGDEQSGHIEGRGLRPVRTHGVRSRGEKYKEPEENVEPVAVSIDLPIEASIPIEYIDSDKLRLEAYRKLASRPQRGRSEGFEEELYRPLRQAAGRIRDPVRRGPSEVQGPQARHFGDSRAIQPRAHRSHRPARIHPDAYGPYLQRHPIPPGHPPTHRPHPVHRLLGQGPMSSDQVVLWTNQLLDDLAWTLSSSKRQSRL